MGIRGPKYLFDLLRLDADLEVRCNDCGRLGTYRTEDMVRYFQARGWNQAWTQLGSRFRCGGYPGLSGCGSKDVSVGIVPKPLPPEPPPPPVPTRRDLKEEQRRARG